MYNDYETLYMIRQENEDALETVIQNFNRLVWKRAHDLFVMYRPNGINVNDLYQEGFIGLHESIYTFDESLEVGFAYFVNLCVVSYMKTALRKCRSQSYKLLDSKVSFDMKVAEDESLFLGDVIADRRVRYNPVVMSHYHEAKENIQKILKDLPLLEQSIYEMQQAGYSYQEIASITQLSTKKIDNVIQKIRRKIQEIHKYSH